MPQISDFELKEIIALVTEQTGIVPRDSHVTGIKNWIDRRMEELEVYNYFEFLKQDEEEIFSLINAATVNETYFFREEKQFELLKNKILPELRLANPLERIRIWSAASSTGEEIYSLHLIAESVGVRTCCTATDINTRVLDVLKNGEYKKSSAKMVDGASFANLLEPYKNEDGSFTFSKKITDSISSYQLNLCNMNENLPKNQHIIFLRNVFIYFTNEMKRKILSQIVDECLAEGGYLFVSMNEVASLDFSVLPKNLVKCCDGKVYYFQKKTVQKEAHS